MKKQNLRGLSLRICRVSSGGQAREHRGVARVDEEERREGGGEGFPRFSFPHAFPASPLSVRLRVASRWVPWRASVFSQYDFLDPVGISGSGSRSADFVTKKS